MTKCVGRKAFIIRKLYGLLRGVGTEYSHYGGGEPFREAGCAGTMSVMISRTPDRLSYVAQRNLRSWAKEQAVSPPTIALRNPPSLYI
jgi:hypothetical protein